MRGNGGKEYEDIVFSAHFFFWSCEKKLMFTEPVGVKKYLSLSHFARNKYICIPAFLPSSWGTLMTRGCKSRWDTEFSQTPKPQPTLLQQPAEARPTAKKDFRWTPKLLEAKPGSANYSRDTTIPCSCLLGRVAVSCRRAPDSKEPVPPIKECLWAVLCLRRSVKQVMARLAQVPGKGSGSTVSPWLPESQSLLQSLSRNAICGSWIASSLGQHAFTLLHYLVSASPSCPLL